ncbi:hypothetical protein [Micromonospora musae]|uniref:hypothetical protein n=1 Tax=Micromonospora musae TaxID=1894970 RepID=UPI0033C28888
MIKSSTRNPEQFLRWREALAAPRVRVIKSVGRTLLTATVFRQHRWILNSDAPQPPGGPRLPNAQVAWDHTGADRGDKHGWTTIADLRNALAALRCRQVGPDGREVVVAGSAPAPPTAVEWIDARAGLSCVRCGATSVRLAVFNIGAEVYTDCGQGAL